MSQGAWTFRKAQPHEDAVYWATYDLAYFCLVMRLDPAYAEELTEQEKAAWIEAFMDIQKQRNSG